MTALFKYNATCRDVAEAKRFDEVRDRRGAVAMLREAYSPAPILNSGRATSTLRAGQEDAS
jgi:hypothetical protein